MTMTMNITREIVFFKNHAEKEARRLVLGLFLFFTFIWGKSNWSAA